MSSKANTRHSIYARWILRGRWELLYGEDIGKGGDMTDKILQCWICCVDSTSDNQVNIVNEEHICTECMHELAIIEEENRGSE
jgi:hypothetical protein